MKQHRAEGIVLYLRLFSNMCDKTFTISLCDTFMQKVRVEKSFLYVPRNIRRERKFLLSLAGKLNRWGRGQRWYWMVGRSVHKLLRIWFGLLINVLKRVESACAAISLKEGASSGRNPPHLARRMKLSRRLRSRSLKYPHQASEPYINRSPSRLLPG